MTSLDDRDEWKCGIVTQPTDGQSLEYHAVWLDDATPTPAPLAPAKDATMPSSGRRE